MTSVEELAVKYVGLVDGIEVGRWMERDANRRRCKKVVRATQKFFGSGFVDLVRASRSFRCTAVRQLATLGAGSTADTP